MLEPVTPTRRAPSPFNQAKRAKTNASPFNVAKLASVSDENIQVYVRMRPKNDAESRQQRLQQQTYDLDYGHWLVKENTITLADSTKLSAG